jgi:hypothetical protein
MHQPRTPTGRPPTIVEIVRAISDAPLTHETHAWLIGRTPNAAALELRAAARRRADHPHRLSGRVGQPPTQRHDCLLAR